MVKKLHFFTAFTTPVSFEAMQGGSHGT